MNLFESSSHDSGRGGRPWWSGKLRYIPITVIVFFLALGGGRGAWSGSGSGSDLPGETAEETVTAEDAEQSHGESEESSDGDPPTSESSINQNDSTGVGSAESDTGQNDQSGELSAENGTGEADGTEAASLTVFVCGSVRYPGVYTLEAGKRVNDAVAAAGGFLDEADTEYWNLAEALIDGEQIRIPTEAESESMEARETTGSAASGSTGIISGGTGNSSGGSVAGGSTGTGSYSDSSLVNLNTADAAELMTLTGIGESRAAAIIAYREENGPFQSIEDIMNVSGIKEGSYAKIKDYICVQ